MLDLISTKQENFLILITATNDISPRQGFERQPIAQASLQPYIE